MVTTLNHAYIAEARNERDRGIALLATVDAAVDASKLELSTDDKFELDRLGERLVPGSG